PISLPITPPLPPSPPFPYTTLFRSDDVPRARRGSANRSRATRNRDAVPCVRYRRSARGVNPNIVSLHGRAAGHDIDPVPGVSGNNVARGRRSPSDRHANYIYPNAAPAVSQRSRAGRISANEISGDQQSRE